MLLPRGGRDHWQQIGEGPTQALVSGYFPVFGAAAAAACPQVKQRHGKNSMNTLRIWGARPPRPLPRYLERRFQLFNRQGDFVIKTKNVDGNPDWGGVSCHHAFYSVHLNAQHCLSINWNEHQCTNLIIILFWALRMSFVGVKVNDMYILRDATCHHFIILTCMLPCHVIMS